MAKIFYYDLETTGIDNLKNGIHQIAAIYEVDGRIKDRLNYKVAPFPTDVIAPKALEVGGVTEEQIRGYENPKAVYRQLTDKLNTWVDRYDKTDKIHLCGFNNSSFDDHFLRQFFEKNGDPYFNAYFFSGSLDVMILASQHLISERKNMLNFKLSTVAKRMGLSIEEENLHDGLYDVELTFEIYKIVTGQTRIKKPIPKSSVGGKFFDMLD